MADNTYSVKVNEETQERLRASLEASGLNNKDFFVHLLSVYELQKSKEAAPILAADIDELEALTRRVNTIFINIAERINTVRDEGAERLRKAQADSSGTIELLRRSIQGFEDGRLRDEERIQQHIQDKERAEQKAVGLESRVSTLEQAAVDKQALILEYKSKNDALSSMVAEYKAAAEENKSLRQDKSDFSRKIDELEKLAESLDCKFEEQAFRHEGELDRLKEALAFEFDKKTLELEKAHQRKLQEQQELYNDKVRSLLERFEANQPAKGKPISTGSAKA